MGDAGLANGEDDRIKGEEGLVRGKGECIGGGEAALARGDDGRLTGDNEGENLPGGDGDTRSATS